MKPAFATLFAALAASAAAAPLNARPEDLESIKIGGEIDKRVAPVAAGIFGVAAGSIANAVLTGATKGATSGSVRGTIGKIFGNNKRSVPTGEEGWTFDDVRELFAQSAVEDLIADEATPDEAAVCVSVAYEVGGDDSQVREATSVQLTSKTDDQVANFDCFLLAAPLNFTVPADQVSNTTVAVNPGPGTWKDGVLSF